MPLSNQPNNNGGGGNSPVNYRLIDPGQEMISLIEITHGEFRGVRFRIGKVGVVENDGVCRLSFTTEIMKKPWRLLFKSLKENDLFTEVTGNILLDLMQQNAQEYNKFLVG